MSKKSKSFSGFRRLLSSDRVVVMGILNVTPDSFSDGGEYADLDRAVERAIAMEKDGAGIIDIGGESTRQDSKVISADEEAARVLPVIKALKGRLRVPISIDTRNSSVASQAIECGAEIVNDVSALSHDKDMCDVVGRYGSGLILMHMKGTPQTMQASPEYDDLVGEIIDYLKRSIEKARSSGVSEDCIAVDPGIGFGKTVEHNLTILNRLDEFKILDKPICIGASRKSFIGKVLSVANPSDRTSGSLAAAVIAAMKGAKIVRAHDVKETVHAVKIAQSVLYEKVTA